MYQFLNVKIFYLIVYTFFCYLMLNITLQYIPYDTDIAFLRIKQDVIDVPFYKIAFFTHVYTAIFVLMAGFTQFSARFRRNYPNIHKRLGWIYTAVIILFAAPSGFYMGIFANGGLYSQIAFCVLAVLWFYFTIMSVIKIKEGDIAAHRAFMIRSFALTLSAITLRLWKYLIILSFETRPMDAYRIVAWLGWVPNLLLAEYIIHKFNFKKMRKLLFIFPLLFLLSCGKSDADNQTAENKKNEKIDTQKANSSSQEEIKGKTAADFKYDPNNEIPHFNSEFDPADIINQYNASARVLSGKEIQNLYKDELELIRNMVYARHGYKFKNPYFISIFDKVEWYIPISDDVNKNLTEIEIKNIELIKRYESRAKKITYER